MTEVPTSVRVNMRNTVPIVLHSGPFILVVLHHGSVVIFPVTERTTEIIFFTFVYPNPTR